MNTKKPDFYKKIALKLNFSPQLIDENVAISEPSR